MQSFMFCISQCACLAHRQDSAAATAANESRRPGGSAAADKNGKLMYGTFHVQGHCRQRFTRISRGRVNPLVQADSIWPGYIIFTPSCPMLGPNRCRNFAGPPVSRTLLLHSVGLQRCNFADMTLLFMRILFFRARPCFLLPATRASPSHPPPCSC